MIPPESPSRPLPSGPVSLGLSLLIILFPPVEIHVLSCSCRRNLLLLISLSPPTSRAPGSPLPRFIYFLFEDVFSFCLIDLGCTESARLSLPPFYSTAYEVSVKPFFSSDNDVTGGAPSLFPALLPSQRFPPPAAHAPASRLVFPLPVPTFILVIPFLSPT